jgi:hypothetical protein
VLNGLVSHITFVRQDVPTNAVCLLGKPTPPNRCAAANVLIGRLMLHDEKRFDHRLEALWTLRDALEYPIRDNSDEQQLARLYRAVPAPSNPSRLLARKSFSGVMT